jgi:hypothetical protein
MNVPIWPGSSSFHPGSTPFGFYDYDPQFQTDADRVSKFCAQRMGYPIQEVELQDINFYTAFEEAITTYGNELYAFKVRDNMLTLEGLPTSVDVNNTLITPNLGNIIRLSQQYGEEIGVGGNVTWYSGSIPLTASVQDYDLNAWAISQSITGGIEIKRVFFYPPPAASQIANPLYGMGFSNLGGVPAIGSVGYGTAGYLMIPTSLTIQATQAIEMQNTVALSNYSFELVNGKLRIFPMPTSWGRAFISFQYIKLADRLANSITGNSSTITNESNAPYGNPTYSLINSVGRQWIFEYTLAISKEMLGYVRGKYSTIPVPGAEVTLNQSDLLASATATKDALIERLRAYFESTSQQALLERRAAESKARVEEINYVPNLIFIG